MSRWLLQVVGFSGPNRAELQGLSYKAFAVECSIDAYEWASLASSETRRLSGKGEETVKRVGSAPSAFHPPRLETQSLLQSLLATILSSISKLHPQRLVFRFSQVLDAVTSYVDMQALTVGFL